MIDTKAQTTVVGLFEDMPAAQRAAERLEQAGIPQSDVSLIAGNESGKYQQYASGTGEVGKGIAGGAGAGAAIGGGLGLLAGLTALAIPGFGPIIAAGPIASALAGAGIGAAAGGLIGGLTKQGIHETDAEYYAEGVRRGGVLVVVRTETGLSDEAADILDAAGAQDIEERSAEWRSSGWTPTSNTTTFDSSLTSTGLADKHKRNVEGQQSIPVVEEELRVGKRQISRGGVRVYSTVSQQPVEENVTLREERVKVDRHPVDRPATEADFQAFREGTIELSETSEEAVVDKSARVVEEVVVGKDVKERTETVRDKVRRSDVKIERMNPEYDSDFRSDFDTRYANRSGASYDQYSPAYYFGSTYANDERYRGRDWNSLESDMRQDWEGRGYGAWEEFKDSIRHGWDKVRGRR